MQWAESERMLAAALGNCTNAFMWVMDAGVTQVQWISTSAGSVLGQQPSLWHDGDLHLELHVEADRHLVDDAVRRLRAGELPATYRARVRTTEGALRWIEYSFTDLREHPEVRGFVGLARDVTDTVADEAALGLEELAPLAAARGEVLLVLDADGTLLAVTRNVRELLGFEAAELQGRMVDFLDSEDRRMLLTSARRFRSGASGSSVGPGRIRGQRLDGSWLTLEYVLVHRSVGVLVSLRDVTREVNAEAALDVRLAHEQRLAHEWRLPPSHGVGGAPSPLSVHEIVWVGWNVPEEWRHLDAEVHRLAAGRLARLAPVMPPADRTVAHLVLVASPGAGVVLARTALDLLRVPFEVAGERIVLRAFASVAAADVLAVACARAEAAGRAELVEDRLRPASGFGAGRRRFVVVDDGLAIDLARRRRLEDEALAAVLGGDLQVRYRPDVDLVSGRLVALEALPAVPDGVPDADHLVELARRAGLSATLHYRLARRVMADVRSPSWPATVAEVRPRVVLRLTSGECPPSESTRSMLRLGGLAPEHLEVVVREAEAGDLAATARIVRDAGAYLVLDGIGARTCISVAATLRPHAVRLDAAVVGLIGIDPGADAVAEGVALVASRLGMTAAADGVATDGQRHALLGLGYRCATGSLFGGPVPLESVRH